MNFKKHSELEGKHAFLSPSGYHWINYDDEKLERVYSNFRATQRGTELHELACQCIKLGIRLPKGKRTLNAYVNDAISYRMTPEQVLYYSENCFGTADAISFKNNFLRIHDLKTGDIRASMHQLDVYDALFCLEYGFSPDKIEGEHRIYQNDDILVEPHDPIEVRRIMDKIVRFDKKINLLEEEV